MRLEYNIMTVLSRAYEQSSKTASKRNLHKTRSFLVLADYHYDARITLKTYRGLRIQRTCDSFTHRLFEWPGVMVDFEGLCFEPHLVGVV